MKRRVLVMLLGAAVLAAPLAAAKVAPRIPRIAVLDWASASPERMAPFRRGLRELGYVEGVNILVDYRSAGGRAERAAAEAAEIVAGGVDVIVALATPAALAVQRATSTIPIVSSTADPIGSGLVGNLARPGGNLTGISNMMPDLESKRMELLRELLPDARRFAFLGSGRDPATRNFVREAQAAAAAITNYASFPRAGGLVSYGVSPETSLFAAARYVDRILKGAKPGDLPIEQPTGFELVLNLRTAKMLGITIPPMTLLRADEVIE